jgi:hypothetical protein
VFTFQPCPLPGHGNRGLKLGDYHLDDSNMITEIDGTLQKGLFFLQPTLTRPQIPKNFLFFSLDCLEDLLIMELACPWWAMDPRS